jgi:hypothetical protein
MNDGILQSSTLLLLPLAQRVRPVFAAILKFAQPTFSVLHTSLGRACRHPDLLQQWTQSCQRSADATQRHLDEAADAERDHRI